MTWLHTMFTMPLWGLHVWSWIIITMPVWGVPALWLLYPIAIQYERAKMGQGWGWWVCLVFVVPALLIDVVVNWTSLAVVFGIPRPGEWTFSTHLIRICALPGPSWTRTNGRAIRTILNVIAPSGIHVPVPESEGSEGA